jgi:hypothetical protein
MVALLPTVVDHVNHNNRNGMSSFPFLEIHPCNDQPFLLQDHLLSNYNNNNNLPTAVTAITTIETYHY